VGLLAAVGFLADWVKLQFQGIDQVLLGDFAKVGDNVGFQRRCLEGLTNLVGDGVGNLFWCSLLGPGLFLVHNLLDDGVDVLLAFLCVPDSGLQDWLEGLLESLLDGWGELSSALVRLDDLLVLLVLLVGAGG